MEMYNLKEGAHQQMDTIRAKLFWQGGSEKSKYHTVKWENVFTQGLWWVRDHVYKGVEDAQS